MAIAVELCAKCGAKFPDAANYCANCGAAKEQDSLQTVADRARARAQTMSREAAAAPSASREDAARLLRRASAPAAQGERELYRTTVCRRHWIPGGMGTERSYLTIWGDCAVTNQRIVVKWENGDISQYMLAQIRGVSVNPEGKFYTRRFKKENPGIMHIKLTIAGHQAESWKDSGEWNTTSARELASQIQNAMLPF